MPRYYRLHTMLEVRRSTPSRPTSCHSPAKKLNLKSTPFFARTFFAVAITEALHPRMIRVSMPPSSRLPADCLPAVDCLVCDSVAAAHAECVDAAQVLEGPVLGGLRAASHVQGVDALLTPLKVWKWPKAAWSVTCGCRSGAACLRKPQPEDA